MHKVFCRTALRNVPNFTLTMPYRSLKSAKPNIEVPTLLDKAKFKFGFGNLRSPLTSLNAAGENMFVVCAEYPKIEDFVGISGLPDTFQSWFSLTCLHLWMCLVRLRREGVEGQLLKKRMLELLWVDLKPRMKTFKILRKQDEQVAAFRMQFYGAVFAYDEGFLAHSDAHLCAAVWKNLFLSSPTVSAESLELLIKYIRKNISHLNNISSSTILRYGTPTFLSLHSDVLDNKSANERLNYCLSYPTFIK